MEIANGQSSRENVAVRIVVEIDFVLTNPLVFHQRILVAGNETLRNYSGSQDGQHDMYAQKCFKNISRLYMFSWEQVLIAGIKFC
jgi:hypothetical protein